MWLKLLTDIMIKVCKVCGKRTIVFIFSVCKRMLPQVNVNSDTTAEASNCDIFSIKLSK